MTYYTSCHDNGLFYSQESSLAYEYQGTVANGNKIDYPNQFISMEITDGEDLLRSGCMNERGQVEDSGYEDQLPIYKTQVTLIPRRWLLGSIQSSQVCACMHVFMFACMHVCMCSCLHVSLCTCVCMCACVCVCIFTCVHVCMFTCAHVCMCLCLQYYALKYVCTSVCISTCLHVCMCMVYLYMPLYCFHFYFQYVTLVR